ncbi:MAG: hypothetical protein J3R72DRAFT_425504 [Linnemannia gamsii]|nr:MAG: hypothetical protein J3R72DRAFT_425504 [Linnemannia gamsii]
MQKKHLFFCFLRTKVSETNTVTVHRYPQPKLVNTGIHHLRILVRVLILVLISFLGLVLVLVVLDSINGHGLKVFLNGVHLGLAVLPCYLATWYLCDEDSGREGEKRKNWIVRKERKRREVCAPELCQNNNIKHSTFVRDQILPAGIVSMLHKRTHKLQLLF